MASKLTASIQIIASPEQVFDYTQDYGNRLSWDTFLRIAQLCDGAEKAAQGVKAWCVSKHGLGMETQYVSFKRPHVTAIKMTKGPFMFKTFAGSWKFEAAENAGTKVTFTYSWSLRFPFSLISPVLYQILLSNVRHRLADLKDCMEQESRVHTRVPV
jgi:ribosome-associated toxin RatA of RatAB toxin-antitoxin module